MSNEYNPHVTLVSPFTPMELPTLAVWMKNLRSVVADDSVPMEAEDFVRWQQQREMEYELTTWAAYRYEELGAYFEALWMRQHDYESGHITPALLTSAQVRFVFKKDVMWGHGRYTALNLVLREVFETASTVFFPLYKHNRTVQELLSNIGASNIGAVAPRLLDGNPVESVLWAITREEWRKVNDRFLLAVEMAEESHSEGVAGEVVHVQEVA